MTKKLTKAVFPVAGLGSRFLPATKASPKEMMPVVDKPLIQYAVEEAAAAGITDMIFITGRHKRAIEDHFDSAWELETELEKKGKRDLLDAVRGVLPKGCRCIYIRQAEPLGLGHAVWCARPAVGDEPFAVLLADDLVDAAKPVTAQMAEIFEREQCSVLGVENVPRDQTGRYGIVSLEAAEARLGDDSRDRRETRTRGRAIDSRRDRPLHSHASHLPPSRKRSRRVGRRDPADRCNRAVDRRGARSGIPVRRKTL